MIAIISGTDRPSSQTLHFAKHVASLLEAAQVEHRLIDLSGLPDVFHGNYYGNAPESFAPFQAAISRATKVIVVSPEYNGSFPGALKYFIDLLKFPESFSGKDVAFLGVSQGQGGALRALDHLQAIFHYLGANVFGRRVMIPRVSQNLEPETGRPVDPNVRDLLDSLLAQFTGARARALRAG